MLRNPAIYFFRTLLRSKEGTLWSEEHRYNSNFQRIDERSAYVPLRAEHSKSFNNPMSVPPATANQRFYPSFHFSDPLLFRTDFESSIVQEDGKAFDLNGPVFQPVFFIPRCGMPVGSSFYNALL